MKSARGPVHSSPQIDVGRGIVLRLAESLGHIAQSGVLKNNDLQDTLTSLGGSLENGARLHPEGFACYFAMLRALNDNQLSAAQTAAQAMATYELPGKVVPTIRPLHDTFFLPEQAQQMRAHFASDSLLSRQINPVPTASVELFQDRLKEALELLANLAPYSHATFTNITTEIIPVIGQSHNGMTFDGCSSVERWGAILINMQLDRTALVLAETLVHESCHSLLFDLANDSYLTLNPADELYQSPLRIDPRPIDGIYHAVFVLSHMYRFLAEVAQNPETPNDMRQEANTLMFTRQQAFNDGYGVLSDHAQLTPAGQEILNSARARVPESVS